MANSSSAKGNPASHRMSNPKRKEKRQRAWNKRQKEKEANKAAQKKREEANRATKRAGGLTPHELNQQENLRKKNSAA